MDRIPDDPAERAERAAKYAAANAARHQNKLHADRIELVCR